MQSQKKYLAKVHEELEGYMILTSDNITDANDKVSKALYEKGFRSKKFVIEDRKTKVIELEEINPHDTVEDLYRILNKEFDSSSLDGYDAYKKQEEIQELIKSEQEGGLTLRTDHVDIPDLTNTLAIPDISSLKDG